MKLKHIEELENFFREYKELGCPDYGTNNVVSGFIKYVETQTPKKDKWIQNTGKMPDLGNGYDVMVEFRNGVMEVNTPDYFRWNYMGREGDIMRYRVVKP